MKRIDILNLNAALAAATLSTQDPDGVLAVIKTKRALTKEVRKFEELRDDIVREIRPKHEIPQEKLEKMDDSARKKAVEQSEKTLIAEVSPLVQKLLEDDVAIELPRLSESTIGALVKENKFTVAQAEAVMELLVSA